MRREHDEKKRACDLIYLDTKRYTSLRNLKIVYFAIIIIQLSMAVMGIAAINTIGVNWKSLFPLVSIGIWSLLYWLLILILQCRKAKKTFELRFLVNGLSGLLVSFIFWILYSSLSLFDNNPLIGFDFSLWILLLYLIFSILYIGLVILGVHKGVFKKIKEKSQTPKALAISAFFSAILPSTGIMGMYTSKILRAHASDAVQDIIGTTALVLVIFLPILAHINFVQCFYCKKYKISCDEYGNTTSPNLEYHKKQKRKNIERKEEVLEQTNISKGKSVKKDIPLLIKILIGILAVPIILIFIVFLVFFIKGFIQGIS